MNFLTHNNRILKFNNKILEFKNVFTQLDRDIIFGWSFEGNSNDIKGNLSNGIDVSIGYAPVYGKINQGAYNFGGGHTTVAYDPIMNLTTAFTISLWVKQLNNVGGAYLISKTNGAENDNNWSVIIDYVSGYVQFYDSTATVYASSAMLIPDSNYHHIVYTYDGTTFLGYIDNIELININTTFTLSTNGTSDLRLFSFNGTGNYPDTYMDMLYVWNRRITPTEVATLYNRGTGVQYNF